MKFGPKIPSIVISKNPNFIAELFFKVEIFRFVIFNFCSKTIEFQREVRVRYENLSFQFVISWLLNVNSQKYLDVSLRTMEGVFEPSFIFYLVIPLTVD